MYGVPLEEAVESMTDEFELHLSGETSLERLGIVLFGQKSPFDGTTYFIEKKAKLN